MDSVRKKMGKFTQLIPFEEAVRRILNGNWNIIGTEKVSPEESMGRLAVRDVLAVRDFPQWNRSLVDGYAVRTSDTAVASDTNPLDLNLNGVVEAGSSSFKGYVDESCTEIYTGGILPEDYDAVVMAEDVERHGQTIRIFRKVEPWDNVEKYGDDIRSGTCIVEKSKQIHPWHISAMISSNVKEVEVYRKLKIAIISTGNELFPGSYGHIENTTQTMYQNYLSRPFLEPHSLGIAHDDYLEIASIAMKALKENDCLIVTGGTSLGGKDEVPEAFSDKGKIVFAGSMIRPGRTLTLYEIEGKPVFSVSGIPVPSLLSFDVFFEEYLVATLGFRDYRKAVTGKLVHSLTNKAGYAGIYRIRFIPSEDGNLVDLIRTKGTGTLNSMLRSNGTLVVPGHIEGLSAGSMVQVKLFGDVN